MPQQRSIREIVTLDLSQARLLLVLMQVKIAAYLHERVEQIYGGFSKIDLLQYKLKTVQQLLGKVTDLKVTDLTEANEMLIVGGAGKQALGVPNRGQQAYYLER